MGLLVGGARSPGRAASQSAGSDRSLQLSDRDPGRHQHHSCGKPESDQRIYGSVFNRPCRILCGRSVHLCIRLCTTGAPRFGRSPVFCRPLRKTPFCCCSVFSPLLAAAGIAGLGGRNSVIATAWRLPRHRDARIRRNHPRSDFEHRCDWRLARFLRYSAAQQFLLGLPCRTDHHCYHSQSGSLKLRARFHFYSR